MDEPEYDYEADYDEPALADEFEWQPAPTRLPGCWIAVAVILVLTLLGSSFAGLIWFFQQNPTSNPTPTPLSTPHSVVEQSVVWPTAVADGRVNRIAYINNDGQIVTIAPDGSDARVLTNQNSLFTFPAWSPDGQKIAAISNGRLGTSLLTLEDSPNANEPRPLYISNRSAPFYLYWSPNSQLIGFLVNQANGMGLHVVPADGSQESRQLTSGEPFYWQWTADSQQLLVHTGQAEEAHLTFLDTVGTDEGPTIATSGYFQTPGLSADGRLLVYAGIDTSQERQIVASNVSTGQEQAQQHAGQVALSLSPQADLLAYISPDSPDATDFYGPLRVMDVSSGQGRLLLQEPVAAFFWSPNGRYLAAFVPQQLQGGLINAAHPPQRLSSKLAQQGVLPTIKLVVIDAYNGDGRVLLTFTPTYTFLGQLLPFFDQYALSHSIWSPDSDALVLPMLEDGRSYIYIVPTQGGSKRLLAPGSMSFWSQQ